jgi:hypothetical protein
MIDEIKLKQLLFEIAIGAVKPKVPMVMRIDPLKKDQMLMMSTGNKIGRMLLKLSQVEEGKLRRKDIEGNSGYYSNEMKNALILGYITTHMASNKRYFQITPTGERVMCILMPDKYGKHREYVKIPVVVNLKYWVYFVHHKHISGLS